MRYKVFNAKHWVNKEYADKLAAIGFKLIKEVDPNYLSLGDYYVDDGGYMDINTLSELNSLIDEFGQIVIDREIITIYDDYLE